MKYRYQVSEEFKQSCKDNIGTNRIGRIYVVEDDLYITESDNLVEFEIEDCCYVNDKFIGTTVAKKITVNILNPDNNINLEDKEIAVSTGIVINGEEEIVPLGNFIIEKTSNEETKEKTKFTGYDYMIKFNKKYEDRQTYPISLREYIQDLCNQVEVELGSVEFVNGEYQIQGNPFTANEDCKTALSNVAQLCGGFAHIGKDNKLYITNLKEAVKETIDGNNYLSFEKNNQYGEVNSLIIRLSQAEGENTVREDAESIANNGLTEITIADNYFLNNKEEREKVVDEIFNAIKGLKYIPVKSEYYGFPYLDVGDCIKILDLKDEECITYVLNHKFKYNGGFSGNIECLAMNKTQTAYKNTVDIKTKFQNVELKVDKINGRIESVVEEQRIINNSVEGRITDTNNNYQNVLKQVEGYATKDDVVAVDNKVTTIQESTKAAIEVTEDIKVNGVSKVTTSTGYTFDANGLTIKKTGASTKSTLNEAGLDIRDATGSAEESLLFAGFDGSSGETVVKSKNMRVEKYLVIGKYSRMEDFVDTSGNQGTGMFWIGG